MRLHVFFKIGATLYEYIFPNGSIELFNGRVLLELSGV